MLSFPAEGSFQLTAARRRLGIVGVIVLDGDGVSTHSRPKAAGYVADFDTAADLFQLTAARRRLGQEISGRECNYVVSTHSRPKAAGIHEAHAGVPLECFNSQPPEGGWSD